MNEKTKIRQPGYLPVGYEVFQQTPTEVVWEPPARPKTPFFPGGYQNGTPVRVKKSRRGDQGLRRGDPPRAPKPKKNDSIVLKAVLFFMLLVVLLAYAVVFMITSFMAAKTK